MDIIKANPAYIAIASQTRPKNLNETNVKLSLYEVHR